MRIEPKIESSVRYKVRKRVLTAKANFDKDGLTNVYIEVDTFKKSRGFEKERKTFRYKTGVKVKKSQWNKKKEEVQHTADSGFDNFKIQNQYLRISTLLNDLNDEENDKVIDVPAELQELAKLFKDSKKKAQKSMTDYIEDYITHRKTRNPDQDSWKEFRTVKNRLIKYQQYKNTVLNFNDMTLSFAFEFEKWMREVPHKKKVIIVKGRKSTQEEYYDVNTIKKCFVTLKTFLNHYDKIKHELDEKIEIPAVSKEEDFGKIDDTTEAPALPLTDKEFEQLVKFEPKPSLQKVKDLMILQCSVGCRIGDLFELGVGKNKFLKEEIVYYPNKTKIKKKGEKNRLSVPYNQYSKMVLDKYDYSMKELQMAEPTYNRLMKELLKDVGINTTLTEYEVTGKSGTATYQKYEVFSSHNCRDTFITMCIDKGIPIAIVMGWVGHTKFEVMKRYIKSDIEHKKTYMKMF